MATQVWPAAGLALVAILYWGSRIWPAIFAGTLVVHWINGDPVTPFIGSAIGNSVEPLLGAYLCTRFGDFHKNLDRLGDVITLIVGAAIVSTAVGTMIAVPIIHITNYHDVDWNYWLQYWIGDSMGVILIAPLLLVFTQPNKIERFSLRSVHAWEWLLFGSTLVGAVTAFADVRAPIRLYFFVPLLLWSAMRLGQRGATITSTVLSTAAIWYSAFSSGPFLLREERLYSEVYLYIFVASVAITALVVAAVVTQRELERNVIQKSEYALQASHLELAKIVGELEKAKRAAEEASLAKSAFLANMSHEIRTPLGLVLGFSELIADSEATTEERSRFLQAIKKNGKLLANVIDDILDLSKVEAGKLTISIRNVALADVVSEIKDILKTVRPEKGIATSVTMNGDLPKTFETDPLRLRQILTNVIGNAIKFTSTGSIAIGISMESAKRLVFSVKDTGKGISSDQMQNLFTPFTQVDYSATRQYGGTGLGLVLARRFAHKLGGDVILSESRLGHGSTFKVIIDPGQINMNAPVTRTVNHYEKRLHDLRILFVDDNSENLALVARLLSREGASIQTVNSGSAAISLVKKNKYDVVLMDLQMPGMDGYQATHTMRSEGFAGPIIALTAHAMKEDRARCLSSGFNDHVSKPVERGMLVNALARYVS